MILRRSRQRKDPSSLYRKPSCKCKSTLTTWSVIQLDNLKYYSFNRLFSRSKTTTNFCHRDLTSSGVESSVSSSILCVTRLRLITYMTDIVINKVTSLIYRYVRYNFIHTHTHIRVGVLPNFNLYLLLRTSCEENR